MALLLDPRFLKEVGDFAILLPNAFGALHPLKANPLPDLHLFIPFFNKLRYLKNISIFVYDCQ